MPSSVSIVFLFYHYKWLSYFQQFFKIKVISQLTTSLASFSFSTQCNLKQSRKQSLNNEDFNGNGDRSLTTVTLCLTLKD